MKFPHLKEDDARKVYLIKVAPNVTGIHTADVAYIKNTMASLKTFLSARQADVVYDGNTDMVALLDDHQHHDLGDHVRNIEVKQLQKREFEDLSDQLAQQAAMYA